jgi:hypothetical protein
MICNPGMLVHRTLFELATNEDVATRRMIGTALYCSSDLHPRDPKCLSANGSNDFPPKYASSNDLQYLTASSPMWLGGRRHHRAVRISAVFGCDGAYRRLPPTPTFENADLLELIGPTRRAVHAIHLLCSPLWGGNAIGHRSLCVVPDLVCCQITVHMNYKWNL